MQSQGWFYRSEIRNDRRRRLLAEDSPVQTAISECGSSLKRLKSVHYGSAEFLDQQLRLLDLIPRRTITIFSVFVAGLLTIAGLEAGYYYFSADGRHLIAAFDVTSPASLAGWFSSLLLLVSSVVCLLIYAVRRHRLDDYRGWFRIWFWAAGCCLLFSVNQIAGLRTAFSELMTWLTGTKLLGDGLLWWIVLVSALLGAIGSRLIVDMRHDRWSLCFLFFAAVAYGVSIAVQLKFLVLSTTNQTVVLYSGLSMLGHLWLLVAMLGHARYVLLDAEGLLPYHETLESKEEAEEDEYLDSAATQWVKVDPPHNASSCQPVYHRVSTSSNSASSFSSSSLPAAPLNRKLTKQEKKALKERLLRERMKRENGG